MSHVKLSIFQEIEEFQDFSITKLVEESKPEPDDVEQLIKLATLLEDIIKVTKK